MSAIVTTIRQRWSRPAYPLTLVMIGLAALVIFAPWRPPGFVSDAWYLLARYAEMPLSEQLARLIPSASEVYRPLTNFGYWLTAQAFALDPPGHFALQVGAHVLAAVLIGALTRALTHNRWAGLAAGAVFLFAPQANETVWDYASLHRVLSAVAVPAAILAYARGHTRLAAAGAVCALLIDEAGVLVLALAGSYELIYRVIGSSRLRDAALSAARRLLPVLSVTILYVALRLAVGIYSYVEPCRSVPCLAVGAAEYLNRLAVRDDDLVALLWSYRPIIAFAVAGVAVALLMLLAPWRWPDKRPLMLGLVWSALGSAFYILTLWPYVADRFVYVPAMGAALVIGAMVAGAMVSWSGWAAGRRSATVLAGIALVVWVGAGAVTLADRGSRWVEAGETARRLTDELYALLPAPRPGTQVVVYGVPRMQQPTFPPGNTGPYVYINGFEWAMRLRYGWSGDVAVIRDPIDYQPDSGAVVLEYAVVDGHFVALDGN